MYSLKNTEEALKKEVAKSHARHRKSQRKLSGRLICVCEPGTEAQEIGLATQAYTTDL